MSKELIHKFYTAFQNKDGKTMADCYHPEAQFSDPVFQQLNSAQVKAMWMMLIERGKDLQLSYSDVRGDETSVMASWQANYTFGATGNKVENRIQATFTFKDGLIYRHEDSFDLPKWCGQALGWKGKLFGRFGFLQNKVRSLAMKGLETYMNKQR